MIDSLTITNFKSFTDIDINLKSLSILTGLNSSGKSSVLQSLRILSNYQQRNIFILEEHGYAYELLNASRLINRFFEFQIKNEGNIYSLKINTSKDDVASAECYGALPIKCFYLSADRFGPKSILPLNMFDGATDVGEHGQYVIDFLSRYGDEIIDSKLVHPKSEGSTLRYNVEAWLSEVAHGVKFRFNTDPLHSFSYSEYNNYRSTNVGFGLSYILPVIVCILGYRSLEDSILLIENPEAHLHPKGQTAMGTLIALAASSGCQLIVETHSDHLIDGVRLAVKNGYVDESNCIINYFELLDNTSKCNEIFIDKKGKLSSWPEGFFDQNIINKSLLVDLD